MAGFLHPFFHLLSTLLLLASLPISNSQDEQAQALLHLKSTLIDPANFLETWKESSSPCRFLGVSCDSTSGEVTGISLPRSNLSGEISPSISLLSNLTTLLLQENSISGTVPAELANFMNLQVLNLSSNSLTGQLPDLSGLKNLKVLDVSSNKLSGSFPPWIGNLSGLVELGLAENDFDEGEIPPGIGNLKNLTWLYMANCNLSGEIPDSVSELSSLGTLDFSQNKLSGPLPKAISKLRKLFKIELYQNNLTGVIPPELSDLTELREIDVSRNQISGRIPAEVGTLKKLTVIQLYRNDFWGELPRGFGDLQFLSAFSIYENRFSGEFPANFGRFSPLNSFDISENNFSGRFPGFLCQNNNLQFLLALENKFSGAFPDSYANCKTLRRFRISQNSFSGRLPNGIWGLPFAVIIDVSDNGFTGRIPSEIGKSTSLSQLSVRNNKLSGEIPAEIGKLSQLQKLYASNNSLSGRIPSEIGSLYQLTTLHLQDNDLSGSIPSELGLCSRLVEIDLSQNTLGGRIPGTLSQLASLNSINLSRNLITGPIPDGLQSLKLSSIDFSGNKLSGRVPPGLLVIAGEEAFSGNPALCIDGRSGNRWDPELGVCRVSSKHRYVFGNRMVFTALVFSALIIFLAGLVLVSYRSLKLDESIRNKDLDQCMEDEPEWKIESFYPLELDAEEMSNLDEEHLIGSGSTGKVYRLDLRNRSTVAVKQLLKGNEARVFMAEMNILGKIRHRNILKLHACLTRGDLSLLVFEFMPNGNLYHALRREVKAGEPELDWNKRYKIAMGAAKGIMYLHHDCSPAIIHRDIKSNNILLDEDYEAKIADFGIAKIAEESDSSCFAGTHGYIAPELAYSVKVTEKSDVYSFGIVLLELLTGHGPVEPQYGEGKDIVYWVSTHLNQQNASEILDSRVSSPAEECMMKVLKVAILCTTKLPNLRPTMREVVNMLIDADPCNLAAREKNYYKNL
ncbi:receptor protein-tyrosine kinase CEPR2-like [Musa acuminata AAA Group]|uniref:receptor protein-tyrosine kinase CEPR2-like n=1 Tax=Musa acuminata AAA Group TaxID=214697 RepID=UPI0031DB63F9